MKQKPSSRRRPNRTKSILRLPDLEHAKAAVLNSLNSTDAKRGYRHAIDEFVDWYCSEPRLAFNRIVVLRYRSHLESRQLAPGTINLRLGAVRRLASEAADDLKGDRKLVPLLNSSYAETDAKLSPDGRWLAYISDDSGRPEIYLTSFPGVGSKRQVSTSGADLMDWSTDGKSLLFSQGEHVYSVDVRSTEGKVDFSTPKEMMKIPSDFGVLSVLPDGKRMLATRRVGQHASASLDLVLNWQHLLQ